MDHRLDGCCERHTAAWSPQSSLSQQDTPPHHASRLAPNGRDTTAGVLQSPLGCWCAPGRAGLRQGNTQGLVLGNGGTGGLGQGWSEAEEHPGAGSEGWEWRDRRAGSGLVRGRRTPRDRRAGSGLPSGLQQQCDRRGRGSCGVRGAGAGLKKALAPQQDRRTDRQSPHSGCGV